MTLFEISLSNEMKIETNPPRKSDVAMHVTKNNKVLIHFHEILKQMLICSSFFQVIN